MTDDNDALRDRIAYLERRLAEIAGPPQRIAGGYATPDDAVRAAALQAAESYALAFGERTPPNPSDVVDATVTSEGNWGAGVRNGPPPEPSPGESMDRVLRRQWRAQQGLPPESDYPEHTGVEPPGNR